MAKGSSVAGEERQQDNSSLLAVGIPALLFGVRLAVAVSLALLTAFYLQLETPSWAGTSAAIVCQPIIGSSLFKGVFRMIGTVVGAVAAVLLTAMFPQDRIEFLFGMLVWVSLCSLVSTLLRNFAAYAAMLAGYTLIIIISTSIGAPEQVFEAAVSRASEICIGIVCGTLVTALPAIGNSPRRLSALLSQLVEETGAHLAGVLGQSGAWDAEGPEVRRMLIKRTAALEPIIDQAAGESPELLQRRSVLKAAMNGLFRALSGARVAETHLRSLPTDDARRSANLVLDRLPSKWGGRHYGSAIPLDSAKTLSLIRNLVVLGTNDLSTRLVAEGAAETVIGLSAATNGIMLLNDPAKARNILHRPSAVFVADYLPALVNAVRMFIGVGATVLFWIVTAWPNGLQAVVFASVTIMIFSPLQEQSGKAALGQGIGTAIAAVVAGVLKFAVLPNHEGLLAFALIIAAALVPLGALTTIPTLTPYFMSAALNLIPLLTPTNLMVYNSITYYNSALGLLAGCAAGGLALILIPPLPVRLRSQRLVDLSIRDLRRLAAGRRRWTLGQWQNRIYARLTAMPEEAEQVQRSYLVATLSVGWQLIRLQRLSQNGRIGAEISEVQASLAAGDLPKLKAVLDEVDREIAAIPNATTGARGRIRARAALRAIGDAVNRQNEYFASRLS
jgi:uncharacterized membrane protein YccC